MKRSPLHNRIRRLGLEVGMAASAIALLATPASAQFRASIQGTVTDSTGGVIPNASLTLTRHRHQQASINATSNESGTYDFNALAPDNYTLTASATGFQTQTIQHRPRSIPTSPTPSPSSPRRIGGTATTVGQRAAADNLPALDTETASINGNIDSTQIQHLPSAGRDVFSARPARSRRLRRWRPRQRRRLLQQPPRHPVGPGGSRHRHLPDRKCARSPTSTDRRNTTPTASRSTASRLSPPSGAAPRVITPTEDSIGNVKVIANGYDAENGRFSGAQVQLTSKTGTNDFHGSAFFRAYRPGLNAYQRYNGSGTFLATNQDDTVVTPDRARPPPRQLPARQSVSVAPSAAPSGKTRSSPSSPTRRERDNSRRATTTGWYETAALPRRSRPPTPSPATYQRLPRRRTRRSTVVINGADLRRQPALTRSPPTARSPAIPSPVRPRISAPPSPPPRGTQDPSYQSAHQSRRQGHGFDGVPRHRPNYSDSLNPTTQHRLPVQRPSSTPMSVAKKDHVAFAIYWVPLTTTDYNGAIRQLEPLAPPADQRRLLRHLEPHLLPQSSSTRPAPTTPAIRWNEITNPTRRRPSASRSPRSTASAASPEPTSSASSAPPDPSNL